MSQESKKQSEEAEAVAAFDPPKGDRDLISPTITVALKIESIDPNYFIEGTVVDAGGSKRGPYLYVDGERIELDNHHDLDLSLVNIFDLLYRYSVAENGYLVEDVQYFQGDWKY